MYIQKKTQIMYIVLYIIGFGIEINTRPTIHEHRRINLTRHGKLHFIFGNVYHLLPGHHIKKTGKNENRKK